MWARLHNILIGIWLMASPGIFPDSYGPHVYVNNRVLGPIVIALALTALHEALRGLRWVNLVIGCWLLLAPWVLGYNELPTVNGMITGVLLIGASLVRGRSCMTFDGGWSALWSRPAPSGS
jgi:hypothetical protein